jgi:hypothetical protein
MVIVNSNNVPATTFASAFSAAGLDQYAFTPSAGQLALSEWPTLGSMIDSGRRVVVFIDNQANFAQVPYLIDEFSNMWEDAFSEWELVGRCAGRGGNGGRGLRSQVSRVATDGHGGQEGRSKIAAV